MDPDFTNILLRVLQKRLLDLQETVMSGGLTNEQVPLYLARYQEVQRLTEDMKDAIEKWNKRYDSD